MLVWRFYMQGTQVYGRSGYAQCCQHEEQTTRRGRDGMTGTWRQRVAPCTVIIVSSLIMSVTTSMLVGSKKTWLPHPKGKSAWDVYFLLFFFRLDDSVRRIPMVKASNCWLYWQWLWDLFSARKFIKSVFFCNIYQTIPMANLGLFLSLNRRHNKWPGMWLRVDNSACRT